MTDHREQAKAPLPGFSQVNSGTSVITSYSIHYTKLYDFENVETGKAEYGVVPIENSNEGVVSHTLDRNNFV